MPIIIRTALAFCVLLAATCIYAQETGEPRTLRVGTKETMPFVIKNADGTYSGISIELWRQIAEELNLTYEYEERDLTGLLEGLEVGTLDAVVGALTITSEREEKFDFTHPFYTTGLSIAVSESGDADWMAFAQKLFSYKFMKVIWLLALVLFGVGVLFWLFEHRKNTEEFNKGILKGIGDGFWLSAVTMTTVGYGDKTPRTFLGRLVALVWMFAALIMISSFTAAIASALTVSQLETSIKGPRDLARVRVGTIEGSTSANFLDENRIDYREIESPLDGLEKIDDGELDAVVYDAPILRYLVNDRFKGRLRVLPGTFKRQDYGFALKEGSNLREPINRSMLTRIVQPSWEKTLEFYFGE